ncbi:toll-like receptor 2 [Mytilus galloprovincialis]|uniref:toll-like receptor 2 n=1 Tax=Mytilus galloprovincialis TaxID=29158 RepID=UPI003F7C72FC
MVCVLRFYFVIYLIDGATCCFTNFCHCSRKSLKTSCFSLTFIPNIPEYSLTLLLKSNTFLHLDKDTFYNVTDNNIRHFLLQNNGIVTVANDTFKYLNTMRTLEISYEEELDSSTLETSLRSVNLSTIETLKFENNGWEKIPDTLFKNLAGANISTLSLNFNILLTFDASFLRPFNLVGKITCRNNRIERLVITNDFEKVKELDLTANQIVIIPKFCSANESTLAPSLEKLTLFDNAIRSLSSRSFRCLNKLRELILDNNRIIEIGNDIFLPLTSLERLSVSHLKLRKLESRAFNCISLQKLQFIQNDFKFTDLDRFDSKSIFQFLHNLTNLDLTRNYLPKNETIFLQMFEPLDNLQKLVLQKTFFSTLPDMFFQKKPFLRILILQGNSISKWDRTLFHNVTSLKILNFNGNAINLINETSFPESVFASLESLDLSYNPFWCTCNHKWFVDYLRASNLSTKLVKWPDNYLCSFPEKLKDTKIVDYLPTEETCSESDPSDIFIGSVLFCAVSIILIGSVTLKCQNNIRNALYLYHLYRRRQRRSIRSDLPGTYEFDVYVVYCEKDRKWVHEVLLKRLEDEEFKVCIHCRDFPVGEDIVDNIEEFMNKSWKFIVIMSNNFAKSEWCQWEVNLVQARRRRRGKNAMVLIMLKQIDSKHMTSALRTLLYTTPYLSYIKGIGKRLFWTAVINGVKKSYDNSPVAVSFIS